LILFAWRLGAAEAVIDHLQRNVVTPTAAYQKPDTIDRRLGSLEQKLDTIDGGFQSGIDGLSSWLMRIIKEVGHGAALQAVRERRAR